ncbi:uncharacterized protein DMAD_11866 [Drosophila madeirensis]|uniref:Neuropeptide-like protein 31 n=1 Tax=Drosophila madeirensis TaxID=30013 RepID=A0AAU9FES1_DROMD
MTKVFAVLSVLAVLATSIYAGPVERKPPMPASDLSTADSMGYGYYAVPFPGYYNGYGGYGGGYKYGGYHGYRSYGRTYYSPQMYPVWG